MLFKMATFEGFVKLHLGQFMSIGLPEHLYERVFEKTFPQQIYDAGEAFVFNEKQSGGGYSLCAKIDLEKHGDVFFVDHAWTNDGGLIAKQQLQKMPQLLARMQNMFGLTEYDEEMEEIDYLDNEYVVSEECSCSLEKARNALKSKTGSLIDAVLQLQYGDQNVEPAMDDTTDCTFEEFRQAMKSCAPEVDDAGISEDYMKKMYSNFLQQKGKGIGAAMTSKYNWLDNEEDGLVEVYVAVKPNILKSHIKSQLTMQRWKLEVEGMGILIDGELNENVIPDESWWAIESPGVLCMSLKKGISYGELWNELIKSERQLSPKEIEITAWKDQLKCIAETKEVLDNMWLYNQIYRVASPSGTGQRPSPVWYIMDEVGTAIEHSVSPNFACAPFILFSKGMALNLIWPICNVKTGDTITRNFIPRALSNETQENYEARLNVVTSLLAFEGLTVFDAGMQCTQKDERQRKLFKVHPVRQNGEVSRGKQIFCDFVCKDSLSKVAEKLQCKVTHNIEIADFVLTSKLPASCKLSSDAKVNHLKGEERLFKKDEVSKLVREQTGSPDWQPETYALRTELPMLLRNNTKTCFGNYWIIRNADSKEFDFRPVVTSDLLRISRLCEAGAMIASKFSMQGPTYGGNKFALSYTAIINRSQSFQVYVHKTPYVRTTAQKYNSLKIYDEYDTSSVVTEKPEKAFDEHKQQDLNDLIKDLQDVAKKSKLSKTWKDIENEISSCIGEIFSALSQTLVSEKDDSSFGLIGIDFILDFNLKPTFLGFDPTPTFSSTEMLSDVIQAIICEDRSKGFPSGCRFVRISID